MQAPKWLAVVVLVVVSLVLWWPDISRPFGLLEVNAGQYLGVSAKNIEKHGWLATQGVPLGPTVLDRVPDGVPYLNHPPGSAWLLSAFGASEAVLRAVGLASHFAAALALLALLQARHGVMGATLGGLALLSLPVFRFYCQVSYEPLVLACGLWTWWSAPRSRLAMLALAFLGVWLDWLYLLFLVALVPMCWGPPRNLVRVLAWPAAGAGAALVLLLLWLAAVGGSPAQAGRDVLFAYPPFSDYAWHLAHRLDEAFTWPAVVVGGAGWLLLLRRDPRLGLALVFAGGASAVLLPEHTRSHVHFVSYLGAGFAAGFSMLVAAVPRRWDAALYGLLLAFVISFPGRASRETSDMADTTFFRDVGRILTEASRATGSPAFVLHDLPYVYGYYIEGSSVWVEGVMDPATLGRWRAAAEARGQRLRFLHCELGGKVGELLQRGARSDAMRAALQASPRRRVPDLEVTLRLPPHGWELRITEAWLYEL